MISEKETTRLDRWIESAVAAGGTRLCGGDRKGAMLQATLLKGVRKEEKLCTEEAFAVHSTE